MRILDRISNQLTTLHKVLLDDLFKLATTVYTEVSLVTFHCFSIHVCNNNNNNLHLCSFDVHKRHPPVPEKWQIVVAGPCGRVKKEKKDWGKNPGRVQKCIDTHTQKKNEQSAVH